VSGRELYKLQNMVRFGQLKIRRERVPSLDQVEEARENVFFEKLRATLDAGAYRKQDRMIDRLLEQGYPSTDIAAALIHLLQGPGASAEPAKAALSADAPSWAVKKMMDPKPAAPTAKPAVKTTADKPTGETAVPPASAGKRDLGVPPMSGEDGAKTKGHVTAVAPVLPAPGAPVTPAQPATFSPPLPPVAGPESRAPDTDRSPPDRAPVAPAPSRKKSFERPPRTGHESGMTTLFFNVGRKHLVTQADIVGKIAGVTRLPAGVVGAIDLQLHHSLVDVATPHAELIVAKLAGIRLKGRVLCPAVAPTQAELGGGESR
jgi:ATP-dependent RNA helicase DeaD